MIFGVIAAAWLVYLVPYFLTRADADEEAEVDPVAPFSASVTIVRRGADLAAAPDGTAVVSTPLTRRAALRELRQIEEQAATRRRRTLIFLLLVQVLVSGLAIAGLLLWWAPAVPAALVLGFVVVARLSVRAMHRHLDARRERINRAGDEQTVSIDVVEPSAEAAASVELSGPIPSGGSLWDPIPITAPTYVSKPLAPRTVRTIDLSAPVAPSRDRVPVVVDEPLERPGEPDERPGRAVG